MGTAIGAPKRKRTKRTPDQIEPTPVGGGMEKVRDCRDCRNYSRNWGVNYCDIPIPPCFDADTQMNHSRDFVHGFTVYAESACACFAPGKHPTRQRFEEITPHLAAEARCKVQTIVETASRTTVTTMEWMGGI